MAQLIAAGITSLDGYINDATGSFDWSAPDESVHTFVNNLERNIGTAIYGRRLYEVMKFWQDLPSTDSAAMNDYAQIWGDTDKIVVSSTLDAVATSRTQLRRDLDWLASFKSSATRDISIGGPTLAAHAIRAGLVDEFHQFLNPVLVGGGTPFFPDDVREDLELTDQHRFDNGVVYVAYKTKNGATNG